MQSFFEYQPKLFGYSLPSRRLKFLEYILKLLQTIGLLLFLRPKAVWIQLPPTFLIHILAAYKRIFNRQLVCIADCHNAFFRDPWKNWIGLQSCLEYFDIIIVHNEEVKADAIQQLGCAASKVRVLEDGPASFDFSRFQSLEPSFKKPLILCPCSFNQDEPIEVILQAARLAPELQFVITGNKEKARGKHNLESCPPNITFSGFVEEEDFNQLVWESAAVLGLTLLEGIQLSVAGEALGAGKPMVLSSTKILKEIFYQGAIYVDPRNPESIAQGCRSAVENCHTLSKAVEELRTLKTREWLSKAESVSSQVKV